MLNLLLLDLLLKHLLSQFLCKQFSLRLLLLLLDLPLLLLSLLLNGQLLLLGCLHLLLLLPYELFVKDLLLLQSLWVRVEIECARLPIVFISDLDADLGFLMWSNDLVKSWLDSAYKSLQEGLEGIVASKFALCLNHLLRMLLFLLVLLSLFVHRFLSALIQHWYIIVQI